MNYDDLPPGAILIDSAVATDKFDDLPEGAVLLEDVPQKADLPTGAGFVAKQTLRNMGRDVAAIVPQAVKGLRRSPVTVLRGLVSGIEGAAENIAGNQDQGPQIVRSVSDPSQLRPQPVPQPGLASRIAAGAKSFGHELDVKLGNAPPDVRQLAFDTGEGAPEVENLQLNGPASYARTPEVFGGTFSQNPSVARLVGGATEMALPVALAMAGAPTAGAAAATAPVLPLYSRLRQEGATPAQAARDTALVGVGTYILQKVGMATLTGENAAAQKLIEKMGSSWVAGAAVRFGAEGSVNVGQDLFQAAVEKGYDGDRKLFDNTLESFLQGGLLGAAMGRSAKGRPKPEELKAVEQEAAESWFDQEYAKLRERQLEEAAPQTIEPFTAMALEEEALAAAQRPEHAFGDMTEGGQPGVDTEGLRIAEEIKARQAGPDGRTTRLKKSPGRGQGQIHASSPVVYVGPDAVDVISRDGVRAIMIDESGKQIRPTQFDDLRGRTVGVVGLDKTTGKIIGIPHKAETTPRVGLYPFEMFYEGEQKTTHIGNRIVSVKSVAAAKGKPRDFLSSAEAAVDQRLAAMKAEGRLYSGIDPELMALWTAKGAIRIARGMQHFAAWSADMVREFGAEVKPHLKSLWASAQTQAKDWRERISPVAGRPDLSGIAEDAGTREIVNAVDLARNNDGLPERYSFAESDAQAQARIDANEKGEMSRLRQGETFGDMAKLAQNVRTAQKLITREGIRALATGDMKAVDGVMEAIWRYRDAMSQVGRGLAEGRGRFATPEERNFRMIAESLYTPDPATEREIRKAWANDNQAKLRELKARQAAKAAAAQKALLDEEGIDLRGLTPEDMRNPVLVAKIGRFFQARNATFGDKMIEYWINSILSAPPSWPVNTVGTGANVLWTQTVEKLTAATINSIAKREGAPTFDEVRHAWKTLSPGMVRAAWGAARMAWHSETSQLTSGDKMELPKVAIGGKTGRVVRIPGRVLRLSDEFMKRVSFEMEMAGLARRQAVKEGKAKGLKAAEIDRLTERFAAEPTPEMRRAAIGEARKQTFTAPSGDLVKGVNRWKASTNWGKAFTFMFPFVSTPIQLLGRGMRISPLGLVRIAGKAAGGKYRGEGGAEAVRDVAETLAGTALAWLALSLAGGRDEQGRKRLTGSRVATINSGEKAMRQRYEPPMSFKVGDRYFSYNRFDPFAAQLATLIDISDAISDMKQGNNVEIAGRFFDNVKGLVRDRTFLQGLSDVVKAMDTGESAKDGVARWAGNFAASWVPNFIRTAVRSTDPMVRDYAVRGKEDWKKRFALATAHKAMPLPAASFTPLPGLDHWGRPIVKGDAPGSDILWRMTVPSNVQDAPSLLNVDRLIFNWNRRNEGDEEAQWWPNKPSVGVEVKGKRFEMNPEEYSQFLQYRGRLVLRLVERSRLNFAEPHKVDIEAVKKATQAATTMARRQWLEGKLSDAGYAAEMREKIKAAWRE